jgi:hypothetical protein
MNNQPIDSEDAAKKEKAAQTMRVIWSILIVIFSFFALVQLYEWSIGKTGLRHILSPLAIIFVGLAGVFGRRNKSLRTVLIAIALIFCASSLITLFVY